MSETIYVVFGTTGEYSDRTEWCVIAYRDENQAKEHVVNATRRANEIEVTRPSRFRVDPAAGKNEFDPDMEMDYTGTSYYYAPVKLA